MLVLKLEETMLVTAIITKLGSIIDKATIKVVTENDEEDYSDKILDTTIKMIEYKLDTMSSCGTLSQNDIRELEIHLRLYGTRLEGLPVEWDKRITKAILTALSRHVIAYSRSCIAK